MIELMTDIPRVAVLLPTSIKTCREMLQGILRYSQIHGPWALQIIEGRENEQKLFHFNEWGCTGIIGNLNDQFFFHFLSDVSVPVILTNPTNTLRSDALNPAAVLGRLVVGIVSCDNAPIGRAAAQYFLDRNFTSFAFVGEANDAVWSEARREAFEAELVAHGFDCRVYRVAIPRLRRDAARERRHLSTWIAKLPKPTALFVANDIRGRQVLDACREAKVSVPNDLSVLSCDNDELYCETSVPQLSSIRMNAEQAGYNAAQYLDRIMRGLDVWPKKPKVLTYSIEELITRYSSETVTCTDPIIERAMAFIRQNTGSALTINAFAEKLGVSRRLLEIRFRKVLNRTIHDELTNARLERVKKLLLNTSESVEHIAETCGFATTSHLCNVFRRRTGTTPAAYRRQKP